MKWWRGSERKCPTVIPMSHLVSFTEGPTVHQDLQCRTYRGPIQGPTEGLTYRVPRSRSDPSKKIIIIIK